jgi:hypothetical protein
MLLPSPLHLHTQPSPCLLPANSTYRCCVGQDIYISAIALLLCFYTIEHAGKAAMGLNFSFFI